MADAARQIGEYAMEALPQLVSSTLLLPAQHRTWVAVAHTGGEGAYLRAAPRLTSPLQAWADDTRLEVVGEDASGDGRRWKRVRDPRPAWLDRGGIRATHDRSLSIGSSIRRRQNEGGPLLARLEIITMMIENRRAAPGVRNRPYA